MVANAKEEIQTIISIPLDLDRGEFTILILTWRKAIFLSAVANSNTVSPSVSDVCEIQTTVTLNMPSSTDVFLWFIRPVLFTSTVATVNLYRERKAAFLLRERNCI